MTQMKETAGQQQESENLPGVVAVTAATFTVVTSEMLPVGLLTPLGADLGISEGLAGLSLTVTGLLAALSAPLVVPFSRGADRRRVLCVLMVLLAAANALCAWAPGYPVLMGARVLVGVAMGGVWALAAGLGPRLAPPRSAGRATALIFSGIAAASVLGVPAGAYLGELAGWRAAFTGGALLSLAVAGALAVLLPPLPPQGTALRLGGVLRLLGDPGVRAPLLMVALLVTGHFAAYTYIRPVLEGTAGVHGATLSGLLLLYGVAGLAGTFTAGATAVRTVRGTLLVICGVLGVTVLLVPYAWPLLLVWGMAYGGVAVAGQTWTQRAAPDAAAREGASSLFAMVINAAIALGALVGGRVADGFGDPVTAMWLGGALALAALGLGATVRAPQ
ncbi:MFS transporter [Streptomyces sp. XC 2026]|uniref:MFS transporter n=1 Tax=Streptomyces sp. XC 2026 TaxID=2782004 RepID=UPI001906732F|nr:MFS transporter [Streptomyces sp. XC 2026]QQN77459.1 MFS transporter [Streptomyces sp. XC 2026]